MDGWVHDLLVGGGVTVLFLLVLAENLFPPIPSEVVLPLAGFLVSRGELGFATAVLAATAGSLVGALVLYALGRLGGRPLLLRHGRLLHLTEDRIDRGQAWFERHGPKIVFFGRMIPGVRSVVSVPAGLAKMSAGWFVVLTAAGSALWNIALIGAGWALGDNWERVTQLVDDVGGILIGVAILAIATWIVIRIRRRVAQ